MNNRTWRSVWLLAVLGVLLAGLPGAAVAAGETWQAPGSGVTYAVGANKDGSLVVAGQRDNQVVARDGQGQQRWSFPTQGTVYGVDVSDDGSAIVLASEDRHVYVLDQDGQERWSYKGPQTFQAASVTDDGQVIAAGSVDRTVTVFTPDGDVRWTATVSDQVSQVVAYGGGRGFRVLVGSRDSRVTLFDGNGNQMWQRTLSYGVRGMDVTANGSHVAVGDDLGNLALLDGATGKVVWSANLGSAVPAVAIDRSGKSVVVGDASGTFTTFNLNGTQLQQVRGESPYTDLVLTANGDAAIVSTEKGVAQYPGIGTGLFTVPEPAPRWRAFVVPALAVLGVLVLAAVVAGLRKRPDGTRAYTNTIPAGRLLVRDVWRARLSYLFLIPTLALLLVFNYYPAFSGIYHAFTRWSPGGDTEWIGLDNFRAMRSNKYLWAGIGNLLILISTGFLKLLVPLIVAEMLFHLRSYVLAYVFRTLFVLQVIVPGVVGVLLWVNVYDPNIGVANQILRAVGLDQFTHSWLGEGSIAIWSIVFIGFPWVSAFALLIFYGGLISIPSELFDSAALDGASTLRRIVNIDVPLLMGQIRLLVILTFIGTVQEFAAIFLTTGGGPGSSTYVPSLELYYQAVRFNNFGGASAIGAVLFVIILLGTIINLRYVKSSVEYSS